jgi:hypothetical protein
MHQMAYVQWASWGFERVYAGRLVQLEPDTE